MFVKKNDKEKKDENEPFEIEEDLEADTQGENKKFILKVSNSSCSFDDITGFVYGGVSSRFWILRKHINSI